MDTTPGTASAAPGAQRPVLHPTAALTDGWATFTRNAWMSVGVVIVLGVIMVVGQFIPFVNVLFLLFVAPALYAGGAGFFLRGARGEQPPFEAAFEGFQRWPSATGVVLVIGCVSMLIMLPAVLATIGVAGLVALVQSGSDRTSAIEPAASGALVLGMMFTYPVLVWWSVRTSMALFVVMEPERPGAIESLKRAWSLTGGSFWRLVGFTLLTIPVALLGVLALCVGVIPAAIVIYFGWAHCYLQLRARA